MNFTGAAIGGLLALATLNAADRVLPVVAFMDAHNERRDGGAVELSVSGVKILGCRVVPNSQIAWYRGELGWREAGPLVFVDDVTPGNTRPAGASLQDFGVWRWPSVPGGVGEVKATILHECRGRIRVTTIGPFEIGEV